MKKKLWIGIGIVAVVAILIGVNIWKSTSVGTVAIETTELKEETMIETVMTPGTLKLNEEQNVYVQAERGEIAEVFVKEGDKVEKGTKLVKYENKQLELEKKQNELQRRSTALEAENLRKQHKEIDKKIEEDEENEMLQDEHDQIKMQQQQTNIELERSQLEKETIEQQIGDLVVTSDIEGSVVTVNEHTAVSSEQMEQKPIIRIGSLNNLIVEGSISEYDTLKIEKGQSVVLTSDAVPDKEWKGKVNLVADLPEESDGMQMEGSSTGVQYPVVISVEEDIQLKPGFQMLVEIETSKRTTNTLPLEAVKQADDADYVYIVKNGKAVRTEIEIGTVSTDQIEIKDGIEAEDQVIADPNGVTDGMEVDVQ
ncbi:efflux RND transporter periplasmic adaptor subunit [Virgibacillus sp. W0181]|uniref:efflux RND transporter periplasmic adaptor subunit n=1 Tax=Virgibacillus sp. W0181 TaxID=3391581 RepID=UPI003F46F8D2